MSEALDRTMMPIYTCSPPHDLPNVTWMTFLFLSIYLYQGSVNMVVAHTHADRLHVVNIHYA